MTAPCYSNEYTPLPPDWSPPDWIPKAPKLEPIDNTITLRLTEAAKGKIFSPPDRLSPTFHKIVTPMITAASTLTGFCSAVAAIVGPIILLNAIKIPVKSFSSFPAWQRYMYAGYALLAGGQTFKMSKNWAKSKMYKDWKNNPVIKKIFGTTPLPIVTEEEIKFLFAEARKNPLFEQMWNIVSTKQGMIQLCLLDKMHFPSEQRFAWCNFQTTHHPSTDTISISEPIISIMNDKSLQMIFSGLIFELANLFQAERFAVVRQNISQKVVDRNELALLFEYIENETINLTKQVLSYGIQHLNWHPELDLWKHPTTDFASHWALCNKKSSPSDTSHADGYRHQWDQFSSASAGSSPASLVTSNV